MSALSSWSHLFHCSLGGDRQGVLGLAGSHCALDAPEAHEPLAEGGTSPAPRAPRSPSVATSSALGGQGHLEPPAGRRTGGQKPTWLHPAFLALGGIVGRWCPWGRAGG